MRAQRGVTLVELMVAVTVMVVAIAAAATVLITAGSISRNAENASDDFDHARVAGEGLAREIQSAGLFTPGGVFIASATAKYSPLYGADGNGAGVQPPAPVQTGTDDVWILLPDRNALREPCQDQGAALAIASAAVSGPLTVQCPSGTLANAFNLNDLLVASNSKTGALLTLTGFGGSTSLQYAEQSTPGFSDSPAPGTGYSVGDLVYRATPWHYFVKAIPAAGPLPAWSGLFRHRGVVGPDAVGRPFQDAPAPWLDELVQIGVEDLQLAYGFDANNTGDPTQYAYGLPVGAASDWGLPPAFNSATPVRTVRLSVVARSRQTVQDTGGSGKAVPQGALTVENHTIPGTDGFHRAVYSRRLELPNLTPLAL